LAGRDHRFTDQLEWRALSNLSESDYAAQVRSACMFVTFSGAEGFPTSCMEAMRSGTLVAGYDGAGGRHLLESGTNCILSPPGDYVTLAYAVAPFLSDIISGNVEKWRDIIDNGRLRAQVFTPEAESNSLISFWKST
jgi:glycosyltransferase involved in cell wall biosynthesis